jgi:hypothetical protein
MLYAIKAAVFYVALGRTTLLEPSGSGFVDLDMFEQEVSERVDSGGNEFASAIGEFRRRYGTRVPVQVIQTFVRNRLSSIQTEKKRILADADRQGKTISVASLRASVLAARPSDVDLDQYLLGSERWLLRLEVKHGSEIPVSVADEEADALSGRSRS